MKNFYSRSLLFAFVLCVGVVSAQTVMFDKTLSVTSYNGDMVRSSTGNYYVATRDLVTSFSPSGVVQWTVDLQFPQLGIAKIMEVDSELVLGGTMVIGQNWSIFLMKLDAQHNIAWMHVYAAGINAYSTFHDACHTSNDEYVIAAYTLPTGPILIKTNSTGTPIWTFTGNSTLNLFHAVEEASDQTILVGCGNSTVLALDTAGTVLWQHAYHEGVGYGPGRILGIAEVPGGYLFTGMIHYNPSPGGVGGFKIMRTDFSGNLLSSSAYTDTTANWAVTPGKGVAVRDSGMYMMLDRNQTFSGGQIIGGLVFIDTAGSMRWTRQYTTQWTVMNAFADTGVVVFGGSDLNPNNYGLMKTDPSGIGLCPSSTIPLTHGPAIIDTTFNVFITPTTISDTSVNFLVAVMNAIFTFPNCIAADIPEPDDEILTVYPNPVTDQSFTIAGVSGGGQLVIRNQLNQVVHTEQIVAFPATVSLLSPLSPGLYIAEVIGKEKTIRSRLIVK